MRTTPLSALLPLGVLLLPSLASANCYSVYDKQNRLAFQSTVAPIDLSARISDSMRARFPGGFFIMIPDDSDCREVRTGFTTSPRFEPSAPGASSPPEELLQAPLLRGGRSDSAATGNAITSREAVRSGNVLNVKRP
jgi:hypothetical protein